VFKWIKMDYKFSVHFRLPGTKFFSSCINFLTLSLIILKLLLHYYYWITFRSWDKKNPIYIQITQRYCRLSSRPWFSLSANIMEHRENRRSNLMSIINYGCTNITIASLISIYCFLNRYAIVCIRRRNQARGIRRIL